MANIFISLSGSNDEPRVDTLTLPSTGETFLTVHFGDACKVTLPGYDHITVCHAFALADAIRKAAEELKAALLRAEAEPVSA